MVVSANEPQRISLGEVTNKVTQLGKSPWIRN